MHAMSSISMPRLSIIIVTYNSRAHIDACLQSLTRTPPAVDHEIVVVDNASTDGTAAAVRERWPAARVIEAGGNLGFAAANNLGIRQTFGELVLLLNPDTRLCDPTPSIGSWRCSMPDRTWPSSVHAWSTATGVRSCRLAR